MSNWKLISAFAHVAAGYIEIMITLGTPFEFVGMVLGLSMIAIGLGLASGKG